MFVASFVVTELITLLFRSSVSEPNTSVPAILGFSLIEWQEAQHQVLRIKATRLTWRIEMFDSILFPLPLLTHLGLLVWAVEILWLPGSEKLRASSFMQLIYASDLIQWIITFFVLGLFGLLCLCLAIGFVLVCSRPFRRGNIISRILPWLFKAISLSSLYPRRPRNRAQHEELTRPIIRPPITWMEKTSNNLLIWIYVLGVYFLCNQGLTWICKRWPLVGKALLIEHRAQETSQATEQSGEEEVENGPIDGSAWRSLCFFVTNLVVCLLWYAFLYDSTRTINPSWTDIFG